MSTFSDAAAQINALLFAAIAEAWAVVEKEIAETFAKQQQEIELITKQKEEAIETSKTDLLTGIPNRRGLGEKTIEIVRAIARHNAEFPDDQMSLVLAVCDIDHFKKFNSDYGYDVGDAVLKQTASVLYHNARANEKVGRLGGEEFVLLLEVPSEEPAWHGLQVTERPREILESSDCIIMDGKLIPPITASFGSTVINPLEVAILNDEINKALAAASEGQKDEAIKNAKEQEVINGLWNLDKENASPSNISVPANIIADYLKIADVALSAAKKGNRNMSCLSIDGELYVCKEYPNREPVGILVYEPATESDLLSNFFGNPPTRGKKDPPAVQRQPTV